MNPINDDREGIVKLYSATVWQIALARTRREDAAEEVYQEVFLRLFKKDRKFREEEHRKAWLIRTTLNCCKGYMAAALRNDTLCLEEVSPTLALPEENRGLYQALLRLPAKYRIPLELYYIEGIDAEECANILRLRPGSFRSRLSRGKAMLKEALKGEGIYV